MRLNSFKTTSGLAAIALGLAALAVPSMASADPGDHGRGGGRWQGQGGGNNDGGGGGWNRGSMQSKAEAPAPQPQPQAQPQPRNWGGDRNGDAPGRGWGSQRPEGGQRYGRDWSNGGTVARPEPAFRNRAPQVQQQAPVIQQRSYADGERNRSYTPRQQGWDGQRWQGQNWNRDGNRTWNGDRRWDGNRTERRWDGNRTWNGDRGGNWNRDWRRNDRYNWQSYRSSHRDTYRMGRYYSPYRDWSYRRLNIGFYMEPLFFGSDYWIDDPWMYRLPEAYGPYRWVRYYDDALLVDIYSGEVVDAIYDFFW